MYNCFQILWREPIFQFPASRMVTGFRARIEGPLDAVSIQTFYGRDAVWFAITGLCCAEVMARGIGYRRDPPDGGDWPQNSVEYN